MFSLRRIHMQQLFRIQTRCKVDLPSSKSFWIMTRHHRKTADSQSARFHVNLLSRGANDKYLAVSCGFAGTNLDSKPSKCEDGTQICTHCFGCSPRMPG